MTLFVAGLVVLAIFYAIVFAVGIWAAWKNRAKGFESHNEIMSVGRRDMGVLLGVFTMTATWVGGGYVNGIAEIIYTPGFGLLWSQPWFGFFIVFLIAGSFYAKKMREKGYITMVDPMAKQFGDVMGGLLCLPAVLGDVCWSAGILIALGGTMSVILGVDRVISVLISTVIAVLYTLLGGLYSVAYTDVVQLALMFVGLWLSVGFAFVNPAVANIATTAYDGPNWLGSWQPAVAVSYVDTTLLLILGSIPFQTYFQRVLATENPKSAQYFSYIAAFTTWFMGIPSLLIGAIGASTDWNQTDYEGIPIVNGEGPFILPIVLRYLTPEPVAVLGLSAVAAASMSSIDSSLLSAASMFSRNVYKLSFRPKAGRRELSWVLRLSIVVFGGLAMCLALFVESLYGIWYLSVDFVYVVLFPHLTCVLYWNPNIYGSIPAYIVGVLLRVGGGDFYLNYQPFIDYPGGTNFPVKTFAMATATITLMVVSWIARYLFQNGIIPERYDFLRSNLAHGGRNLQQNEDLDAKHGENNSAYISEPSSTKL